MVIQKYEISVCVEEILATRDEQIPWIITGTLKTTDNSDLYVNLWDGFNPYNPLNDDTKEWFSRYWKIQVSKTGINKIHPKYVLFEFDEELSADKKE